MPLILILVFLASCSEKNTQEQTGFAVFEPEVISYYDQSRSRFNDYKIALNQKALSSLDTLSFEKTKVPFQLDIKSQCRNSDSSKLAKSSLSLNRPQMLVLWQLISIEVLEWSSLAEDILSCEFQFSANSPEGSIHKFSWEEIKIQLEPTSELRLFAENLSNIEKDDYVDLRQLQDLIFSKNPALEYDFLCDDFEMKNFINLRILANQLPMDTLIKKNIKCRVFERTKENLITSYSHSFYITPKVSPLSIISASPNEVYRRQKNVQMLSWLISNNTEETKFIYIEHIPQKLHAYEVVSWERPRNVINGNLYENPGTSKVVPEGQLQIPPLSQLKLSLYLVRNYSCSQTHGILTDDLSDLLISIFEVRPTAASDHADQILTKTKIKANGKVWVPGEYYSGGPEGNVMGRRPNDNIKLAGPCR